jgi:hypothetical protein
VTTPQCRHTPLRKAGCTNTATRPHTGTGHTTSIYP